MVVYSKDPTSTLPEDQPQLGFEVVRAGGGGKLFTSLNLNRYPSTPRAGLAGSPFLNLTKDIFQAHICTELSFKDILALASTCFDIRHKILSNVNPFLKDKLQCVAYIIHGIRQNKDLIEAFLAFAEDTRFSVKLVLVTAMPNRYEYNEDNDLKDIFLSSLDRYSVNVQTIQETNKLNCRPILSSGAVCSLIKKTSQTLVNLELVEPHDYEQSFIEYYLTGGNSVRVNRFPNNLPQLEVFSISGCGDEVVDLSSISNLNSLKTLLIDNYSQFRFKLLLPKEHFPKNLEKVYLNTRPGPEDRKYIIEQLKAARGKPVELIDPKDEDSGQHHYQFKPSDLRVRINNIDFRLDEYMASSPGCSEQALAKWNAGQPAAAIGPRLIDREIRLMNRFEFKFDIDPLTDVYHHYYNLARRQVVDFINYLRSIDPYITRIVGLFVIAFVIQTMRNLFEA